MIAQANSLRLPLAQAELLRCIARRGLDAQADRWGQAIGEMDWACEVMAQGGDLPEEFWR